MQSTPQLTRIWLRTIIVYPLRDPQKIILKLSCRKDSGQVLLNKKRLKQLKPGSLNCLLL